MNHQKVTAIFNEFVEVHLAHLGFSNRDSNCAERTLPGFRQLISWNFTTFGLASTFDLDVHLSYAHELDDALSSATSTEAREPRCSGYVKMLHMFDALNESDIKNGLLGIQRKLFNFIVGTQSAAQIYTAVHDDLSVCSTLLGYNQMGMSFNYAYCMEIAGMKREAAQMYVDLFCGRRSNRSSFAIRLREAARERAIALNSYLSEDAQERLAKSKPANAVNTPVVADAIPEPELAKRIIPQHLPPTTVSPTDFTEAIVQAYAPATTFWFNIDAERLASELANQYPSYMKAVSQEWTNSGCGSFHEDLVHTIRTRQFDEYAARWLLSLPQEQVSNDDDDEVYELLRDHLKRTRNLEGLRYLELDGAAAIRYIRARMDLMLS